MGFIKLTQTIGIFKLAIHLYQNDIPDGLNFGDSIAIDTETQGLILQRDRLCLIQLSDGNGDAHLVQFKSDQYEAPNLKNILSDPRSTKIFHFARFDLAVIKHYLQVSCGPIFCTKIASLLTRTYTEKHGLRDLCGELLGIEISKEQQQTDWAAEKLSEEQKYYAATDVLYLHKLKHILSKRLIRENRWHLAEASFNYLPVRVELDLSGWSERDIFSHS